MERHPYADMLAQEIRKRRTILGVGRPYVAKNGGPSEPVQKEIEDGRASAKMHAATLGKYDEPFQWPEGTAANIAKGIRPPSEASGSTLPKEVRDMLGQIQQLQRQARQTELPADIHATIVELGDSATDLQLKLINELMD